MSALPPTALPQTPPFAPRRAPRPPRRRSADLLVGLAAASLLTAFLPSASAQTNLTPPQIRNLASVQRPGTFFVDVTYDLIDPDSERLYIRIEASSTGGTNYLVPMATLSGDVGLVTPGLGKKIVWNAWNDWAGNYTTNAKVRLIADDTQSVNPPLTNAIPSNLAWIPSGSFNMSGAMVYLSRGFYMAKCELTQAEYMEVMTNNPSGYVGPTMPVDGVTWNDATNYCAKLNEREQAAERLPVGWTYRLPTEAQWEYACRAGTTNTYSFGDDPDGTRLNNYAWYHANSGGTDHSVGSKLPNAWGLYDMYGNVWEWCSDWYASLPSGIATDPAGPGSGSARVLRGGGYTAPDATPEWDSNSRYGAEPSTYARSYIYNAGWNTAVSRFGFRVVLAPVQ